MRPSSGFTLPELLIGATLLMIGIVAMLGVTVSQFALNEHARNLSWASNDATRVMERIRQQNSGSSCATPSGAGPAGFASWDAWLADTGTNGGGGKSVESNQANHELVVVTTSGTDPLTVTVAICWRHRGRVIGECAWNGSALAADESLVMASDTTAIDSPAMLSTLMTCRK
ncbi:MAG: prepilin-type N-terminal cleavage/methylation domain-containing protein [Candidatus Omnitrophica bacterium]|nr:prepilin-type N-terminal cleavage/methylation domain-containing protein [Candidatus Omnitrophota bacterium]